MNPTAIDRKTILKRFNLDRHPKIQTVIPQTVIPQPDISSAIKELKIEVDKRDFKTTLPYSILVQLPSDIVPINTRTDMVADSYIYNIDLVVNSNKVDITSNKLVHLCIFNIIERPQTKPFFIIFIE